MLWQKKPKTTKPQQSTFIKAISLKRKYNNDVLIAGFYIQFYLEEQNWPIPRGITKFDTLRLFPDGAYLFGI